MITSIEKGGFWLVHRKTIYLFGGRNWQQTRVRQSCPPKKDHETVEVGREIEGSSLMQLAEGYKVRDLDVECHSLR